MPAHLKSCNPSCITITIGMQRHKDFGLQACLMFITARGVPTGHPSARAWNSANPGRATLPQRPWQSLSLAATARVAAAVATETAATMPAAATAWVVAVAAVAATTATATAEKLGHQRRNREGMVRKPHLESNMTPSDSRLSHPPECCPPSLLS